MTFRTDPSFSVGQKSMNDQSNLDPPDRIAEIEAATKAFGFRMASDYQTGALLRTLASTKPAGRFLELGTGTGLSTAWLLDGMDNSSRLITVDNDERVVEIARKALGDDPRVRFHVEDGSTFLRKLQGQTFDLIFADTWPGKIWDLELALDLLGEGGIYAIDDMCYQPHWPEDHLPKVQNLIRELEDRTDLLRLKLCWSTGIVLVTRRPIQVREATPQGKSPR